MKTKAFIIGDIHGCLTELKKIITKASPDEEVFITGDLIDRGPDSRGVINYVRDNNIKVTLGNHELMAIECLPGLKSCVTMDEVHLRLKSSDWYHNGGNAMTEQYSTVEELLTDIRYLDTFPVCIIPNYKKDSHSLLISHTLIKDKLDKGLSVEELVWGRSQHPKENTLYFNVFGHTPVDYVNDSTEHPLPIYNEDKATMNIDTGAPYNAQGRGVLSAVHFPSLKIEQVKTSFN